MAAAAARTILTYAVTGSITTPQQHAGLPVAPKEIAAGGGVATVDEARQIRGLERRG